MEGYDLTQYRSKIAQLDDEIIDLLIKRFELTDEIGIIKKKNNIPIENISVEKQVLERLTAKSNKKIDNALVSTIYTEIFNHSKNRQRRI